ncbi:hypothetical protein [Amycolatopsis sp. CA-128772]|uniref:hypothetical protein n=1 Tax=Amycolatopsis sp. CA-128772 TaxID=2073159 RepID=UPI000CD08F01|nr:hypothetical protein [Amycolatopsis sp. CA-128772]
MDAADVNAIPVAAARPQVGMLVADGVISLSASGMTAADSATLINHLAEACELASGVVLFDVAGCALNATEIVTIVQNAARRCPRTRCHLRVISDDRAIDLALGRAGIRATARIPWQPRSPRQVSRSC